MALTVLEIVRLLDTSGKFSSVSEAEIAKYEELTLCYADEAILGDCYNQAIALAVLHFLENSSRDGASGTIRSEKEGDLARSYGGTDRESMFSTTSWGKQFNDLMRIKSLGFCNGRML
jgi:hypothetical protein